MPDRYGFALSLADRTGLDPEVTLGWAVWESDPAHEANHPYNWTNWKDSGTPPDYLDGDLKGPYKNHWPAKDGGTFPGYFHLHDAIDDCVRRYSNLRYAGIQATVGKSQQEQVDAIKASDWGTHSMTIIGYHDQKALMWCWISWYTGRDWAKDLGKRNQAHRPRVFPRPIPLTWWARLTLFLLTHR